MSMRIPRLSRVGTRELMSEMEMAPADTPERRETFRRAEEMHRFVVKVMQVAEHPAKTREAP